MRNLIILTLTVIIIGEGNATYLRNDLYRDETALHTDTIEKAPLNPRPYIAIAVEKLDSAQYDEALEYLRKAERIYQQYPDRFQENWIAMIYYNAGLAYRDKEEDEKAIKFFLKSSLLDPAEWRVHVNLGILYFAQKDYMHAEDYLYNAVLLHPDCPADLYNLFGRALYANEKYDEALVVFQKGLEVRSMNVLHYNLAATYLKMGQLGRARSEIINMPYQSTAEGIYYMYKALLFPNDRNQSIKKAASILVSSTNEYCDWLSVIMENNNRNVVFPEISAIADPLLDAYQQELSLIRDKFTERMNRAGTCEEMSLPASQEEDAIK